MKCIEETVTATDGLRLYIRRCEVPNGTGEVLITHGFGEHSGRYDALMEHLTNHGYSVTAYDHRGHGLSDGLPGHVESFDEYDQDLAKMVETIRALRQPNRVFLIGHSMGGLVALRSLARGKVKVDAAVISAPLIE